MHTPEVMQRLLEKRIGVGGMGVGISSPRLAFAATRNPRVYAHVSLVAGEFMLQEDIYSGRLDPAMAEAFATFPDQAMAEAVWRHCESSETVAGWRNGVSVDADHAIRFRGTLVCQALLYAYCAVKSVKLRDPDALVAINLMQEVEVSILPFILGAMAAGVDMVTVGAGIPKDIPRIIYDLLARQSTHLPLDVHAKDGPEKWPIVFDLPAFSPALAQADLKAPVINMIVTQEVLALHLEKSAYGAYPDTPRIITVEEQTACGGHTAPPRGKPVLLNERDEPVYGPRDACDYRKLPAGIPYVIGGGFGDPEAARHAIQDLGATAVQVGGIYALARESGMRPDLKHQALEGVYAGNLEVLNRLRSPTGFPFKEAVLDGTLAVPEVYGRRRRICRYQVLGEWYETPDGRLDHRCPAMDPREFAAKGGDPAKGENMACLCPALSATAGYGPEKGFPIVTLTKNLGPIRTFLQERVGRLGRDQGLDFGAADVNDYLLGALP